MLKIDTLTRLAEALSGIGLIQEIDQLKAEVDSHRPISKEIQDRIFQKFRLDWNYNSNAIEGNKLTYSETVALLMHGITAKGKPLKDHMDVKGHNEGINLLLDIVKSERDFTQNDIRSLHEIILVESYSSKTITKEGIPATRNISIGQYKTTPNHVKTATGAMHYYASPTETPALMDELMDWYEAAKKNDKIHPFIIASLFHHRFVSIHPFDDGNGRMTRILMNLILMRNQYPLIVVPMKLREEYYGILSQADVNEFEPMIDYFGGLLKHSLEIQLKGIKGEDISESDDIDKEIELFVKSHTKKNIEIKEKTKKNVLHVINSSIIPLLKSYLNKVRKFKDLFLNSSVKISVLVSHNDGIIDKFDFDMNRFILSFENGNLGVDEMTHDIELNYTLSTFQKASTPFDITDGLKVNFSRYKYEINDWSMKEVIRKNKPYNEDLSNEEIEKIVKSHMKFIIEKIKKKSNQ